MLNSWNTAFFLKVTPTYRKQIIKIMKKKLTTLAATLILSSLAIGQTNEIPKEQRKEITHQIEKNLKVPFDKNGRMVDGHARVSFFLSDSSTINITAINTGEEVLRTYLKKEMNGLPIKARKEDLGKNMAISIWFDVR